MRLGWRDGTSLFTYQTNSHILFQIEADDIFSLRPNQIAHLGNTGEASFLLLYIFRDFQRMWGLKSAVISIAQQWSELVHVSSRILFFWHWNISIQLKWKLGISVLFFQGAKCFSFSLSRDLALWISSICLYKVYNSSSLHKKLSLKIKKMSCEDLRN